LNKGSVTAVDDLFMLNKKKNIKSNKAIGPFKGIKPKNSPKHTPLATCAGVIFSSSKVTILAGISINENIIL